MQTIFNVPRKPVSLSAVTWKLDFISRLTFYRSFEKFEVIGLSKHSSVSSLEYFVTHVIQASWYLNAIFCTLFRLKAWPV